MRFGILKTVGIREYFLMGNSVAMDYSWNHELVFKIEILLAEYEAGKSEFEIYHSIECKSRILEKFTQTGTYFFRVCTGRHFRLINW
jgi:hypothetical protein